MKRLLAGTLATVGITAALAVPATASADGGALPQAPVTPLTPTIQVEQGQTALSPAKVTFSTILHVTNAPDAQVSDLTMSLYKANGQLIETVRDQLSGQAIVAYGTRVYERVSVTISFNDGMRDSRTATSAIIRA